MIKLLLNAGADVNIHDNQGQTAADIATSMGDMEIANILQEAITEQTQ